MHLTPQEEMEETRDDMDEPSAADVLALKVFISLSVGAFWGAIAWMIFR